MSDHSEILALHANLTWMPWWAYLGIVFYACAVVFAVWGGDE